MPRNPFWPPLGLTESELVAVVGEHDQITPDTTRLCGTALDVLGVDYDGAPDAHSSNRDAVHLACVIVALAATVVALRATTVNAEDVAPVALQRVLADLHDLPTQEAHVCIECDQEACVCWAYDETLPAPVDVADRRAEAHSLQLRMARVAAGRQGVAL